MGGIFTHEKDRWSGIRHIVSDCDIFNDSEKEAFAYQIKVRSNESNDCMLSGAAVFARWFGNAATCWVTRLELEDQWSSLNWNHKQEDFNAYLGRFRDIVRRLVSCGATVDEAAQTAKLLKCLPKEMNVV